MYQEMRKASRNTNKGYTVYPNNNIGVNIMYTYFLRHKEVFNELLIDDQCVILNNLQEAYEEGNHISIRGQDMENCAGVCATLYGCYQLTPDEVSDYYANGGQWTYLEPALLYKEFTGVEL